MINSELNKVLSEKFDLNNIPSEQREVFLERTGGIIVDSALNRLLTTLSEGQVAQLDLYLVTNPEVEDVLSYLLQTYPDFMSIVEEEILAFQNEAAAVID